MGGTDCALPSGKTTYLYFDWEGNVITGLDENGKSLGLGGMYAGTSIYIKKADGNNRVTVSFTDDNVGWAK